MDSFTSLVSGTSQQFFAKLSESEALPCFVRIDDCVWISWNPVASFSSTNRERCWGDFVEWKEKHASSSKHHCDFFLPRIVGAISYDVGLPLHHLSSRFEEKSDVCMSFSLYEEGVLIKGSKMMIVGSEDFQKKVHEIDARPMPVIDVQALDWTASWTEQEHAEQIEKILSDIRMGEYYQLNLTYQMQTHSSVNHRHLFSVLDARFTPRAGSYLSGADGTHILSLSPETFIDIDGRSISTCPIKGTRKRGMDEREDGMMQEELVSDEKEKAELSMIVDLLRNDLGKICTAGSVRVTKHREMLAGPLVWHTASTIEGTLRDDLSSLDALREMFPGGSITGCPKRASMRAIDALETAPRGFYTGTMVAFDQQNNVRSSILIRTIVAKKEQLSLGVGGGIVIDSIAEKEWEETRRKVKPFLELDHQSSSTVGRHPLPIQRLPSEFIRGLTWINGKKVENDDLRITLLDPSNSNVFGVFETLLCTDALVHDLDAHLQRLEQSAHLIGIQIPQSLKEIENDIVTMMFNATNGRQKLKIVCTNEDVILALFPIEGVPLPPRGTSAITLMMERNIPQAKALPYTKEYSAHQKAITQGCSEAILLNSNNEVTEGAYSNVFWVKDGTLFTRENDVLQGITRAKVMEYAKQSAIPFRFATISREELLMMDEVFITSSLRGIRAIHQIDGVRIGDGEMGEVTKEIERLYSSHSLKCSDSKENLL